MRIFFSIIFAFLWLFAFSHDHENKEIFVENKGQWHPNVKYNKTLPYGNLYLEKDGFTYNLYDKSYIHELHHNKRAVMPDSIQGHAIMTKFVGISDSSKMIAHHPSSFYLNYILGNDPSKWTSYVRSYEEIFYKGLYSKIDLKVYESGSFTKYDYIIKPGGDPSQIKVAYSGTDALFVQNGNLYVLNKVNDLIEQEPYAYQIVNGEKIAIACHYIVNDGVVSYQFPEGYDQTIELIIDPVIVFSTFTGSTADNFGFTATYDDDQNAYAGGIVFSAGGYPITPGAFQVAYAGGGVDMSISKFSADGTALLYSTYLGGSLSSDAPHSLVTNANDELFILGTTGSADFPVTPTAFDTTFNGGAAVSPIYSGVNYTVGSDIVVSRLNATGTALLGSTYVGGTANDGLNTDPFLSYNYGDGFRGEIIIDQLGNCIVATVTNSPDFPIDTLNATQPFFGGGFSDGVTFKLAPALDTMVWGTFIGGAAADAAYGTQFDSGGDVYITGGTMSTDFPVTLTAIDTTYNGQEDGFISRFNVPTNTLVASTYIGTPNYDQSYFVQLDLNDDVYITGQSNGGTYPIIGTVYSNPGSAQFIHKLTGNLDSTIWSTQVGSGRGTVDISPSAFLVNVCGFVYLSGWGGVVNNFYRPAASSTTGLPLTPDAYQSTTDGSDFYLMVLNNDAANLLYGSFFGGPVSTEHVDGGTSRFDKQGNVYQSVCAGCGGNSDFPTTAGAWSNTNNSFNCNLGLFKLNLEFIDPIASVPVPFICLPDSVSFSNNSSGGNVYWWDFGDGDTSDLFEPTHVYSDTGSYTVTLIVSDSTGCIPPDTAVLIIDVYRPKLITIQPVDTICLGDTVQIDATGGQTFLWTPSATLVNDTVEDPYAFPSVTTTYQLISHHYCNSDTGWVTVPVQTQAIYTDPDTIICSGDSIQLSAYGAVTYNWYPNVGLTNGGTSSPTFSPPSAMYYYVDGVTSHGCTFTDSIYIDIHMDSMTIIPDTSICLNQSINFYSTGGGTYLWSPSSSLNLNNISNPTASPTSTTIYYLDVISSNGCPLRDSLTLTVHIDPHTIIGDTGICLGDTLQMFSTGGGSFSWTPSGSLDNAAISSPRAFPATTTQYFLNIVSPNGCPLQDSVTITVFNDPTTISNDTTICLGNSANLYASGGVSYTWNPGSTLNNTSIPNPIATPSLTTQYYVDITTPNGCLIHDSVLVTVDTNIPNPWISNDTTICLGDTIDLFATGATSYTWTPSGSLVNNTGPNVRAFPSTQTTYLVTYENTCGIDYDTVTVNVNAIAGLTIPDQWICRGDSVWIWANGGVSYSWYNNSSILTALDSAWILVRPNNDMTYYVDVQDAFGCQTTLSVVVNLYQDPIIDAGEDIVITYGGYAVLGATGTSGALVWTPADSLSCSMCPNPVAAPSQNTTYYVTVTDSNGCQATDSVTIYLDGILFVPNSFSPDGDGKNDYFYAKGQNITEFKLWVFNRWGQLIFESSNLEDSWDGTYKGLMSKTDTYVWRIKYAHTGNTTGVEVIGHVNLLR